MEGSHNKKKKSLVGMICSSETLFALVGIFLVGSGVKDGFKLMPLFFGICIVIGSFMLRLVRRKDWGAHWAEMERIRQTHERRLAEEKEDK